MREKFGSILVLFLVLGLQPVHESALSTAQQGKWTMALGSAVAKFKSLRERRLGLSRNSSKVSQPVVAPSEAGSDSSGGQVLSDWPSPPSLW